MTPTTTIIITLTIVSILSLAPLFFKKKTKEEEVVGYEAGGVIG